MSCHGSGALVALWLHEGHPRGDEDQGYDIKYRAACVRFVLGSQVHLVFQMSVYDFGAVPKEVFFLNRRSQTRPPRWLGISDHEDLLEIAEVCGKLAVSRKAPDLETPTRSMLMQRTPFILSV